MAKKSALGTVLALGVVAAAGVAAYLKKDELKKAAEDLMARIKAGDAENVYTCDCQAEEAAETPCEECCETEEAEAEAEETVLCEESDFAE